MEQTHPTPEPVHGKPVRGLLDRLKDAGPLVALLCTVVGTGVAVITAVVMIGANINSRLNAIDARLHTAQIEENRRFDAVQTKFDAIQAKFDAAQIEENRRFDAITARLDTMQAEYNRRFDAMQAENNRRFDAAEAENDRRFDAMQTENNRQFEAINARLDQILEALRDHEGRISRLEERSNPTAPE